MSVTEKKRYELAAAQIQVIQYLKFKLTALSLTFSLLLAQGEKKRKITHLVK